MIKIRHTRLCDIDHIMEWVNDPTVLEKFANFKPVTKEQELIFLANLICSKNDETYTIETASGEYVGQISINKIYWAARNGRLAITIHPKQRKKGYATQALKLVIDKAFNEVKLHKLWLMLRLENKKGLKLFKSLGFEVEAKLKDEYVDPKSGEYVDMIRMYKINDK